jgi:integrase/recombinase XerD
VWVRSKGGDLDWLHFQTGSAGLLPRLIAGRTHGPLFLADRAPAPARTPAAIDRCPETGRARLSYRRAEALFRQASGGWTLHQLRHSALTHLAEQNVSLPLLMAKAAMPTCGRCSATPALEPKRLRRSPQLLISPDAAAD